MNATLQELKQKRLKWVEANRENGFDEGINRLLTDLYPDNAHFIYELLQNAEDPRATAVTFTLSETSVEFEHNGERLFTLKDVESITSIGNSTKRDDHTSIGKFGVGFKAVFAYTNTPEIHSGDYHFRIHELVVPETNGVSNSFLKQKTRFIFPFDNPKKSPQAAVTEIERGLRNLGDNTLLFLNHIRKIEYLLPDGSFGSLERHDYANGRIEMRANHPHSDATVSHWLHFQKDVEVADDDGKLKTCRIAIAYQLEPETGKNKDKSDWKIISVDGGGQVSIYFPAEKETSKLRFHIHAPFASTVARDSVRDCPANDKLRDHLAELIAESLIAIRDQNLLIMDFLAVLPNLRDYLTGIYEPIRKAIVAAFNNNPLTPTKNGKYAKADALYRGPIRISEIINDDDLSLLTNDEIALWSANAPQRNQREDNFLDSLAIKKWEFEQLSAIFKPDEKEKIQRWLEKKDAGWLMRFYGLLNDAKENHDKNQSNWSKKDWPGISFPLVRVNSIQGIKHIRAKEAYFESEDKNISPPADIFIVKRAVYTKDDVNDEINQPAKNFLQNIGVKPFDTKAAIELRLKHYQSPPEQISDSHYEDIKQFIAYWKKNREEKSLFQSHSFLLSGFYDNKPEWEKATKLCLDAPFSVTTGLAELVEIHQKKVIWEGYLEKFDENELKNFIEFVQAIGVMYKLEVIQLTGEDARKNPNNPYNYGNWTHTGHANDYSIPELEKYLGSKNIFASRLIWNALISLNRDSGIASFKPNQQYTEKKVESQLIYFLKNHAWIPNTQGEFYTPRAMTYETLRTDFHFIDDNGLLTKLDFGKDAREAKYLEDWRKKHQDKEELERQQAIQNYAQDIGLNSADELVEAARLTQELGGIDKLRSLVNRKKQTEQPYESVSSPERRRSRLRENSADAPDIQLERSIQKDITEVKAQAKAYLRPKYKNSAHELICQCCHEEMPFKLGEYHYFEAVQCVKGQEKRHFQNYLALCPTCAAMYKYARIREPDDTEIRRSLIEHNAPDDAPFVEIPVMLAGKQYSLHFVGTHWFDLKTVLENS
jgi:hypothetical protein